MDNSIENTQSNAEELLQIKCPVELCILSIVELLACDFHPKGGEICQKMLAGVLRNLSMVEK